MKNIVKMSLLGLLSTLFACGDLTQSEKNSQAIKEAIKSREIKKVSEVDILNRAKMNGDSLMVQCNTIFQENLDRLSDTIDVNRVIVQTQIQVNSALSIDNGGISLIYISKSESATDLEKQLLEAYLYNVQNELNLNTSVQLMPDVSQVLYTDPIVVADDQCSSCPQMGGLALIGMWAIKFPVKELVSEL